MADLPICFRKSGPEVCSRDLDAEFPYYKPLNPCISGIGSHRWVPIEGRRTWPSRAALNSAEVSLYGN